MAICAGFQTAMAARSHGPWVFGYPAHDCRQVRGGLFYDHRGFGDSGGEPRLQLNSWIQDRGYRDALSYGRSLEGVDASRVAIWGDSFSGGVALAVAAVDERVTALVVQVPAIWA